MIYDISDDVEKAMLGLLDPRNDSRSLARPRCVMSSRSPVGMIAGCYVTEGGIERMPSFVSRDDIVIENDRKLSQLKRFGTMPRRSRPNRDGMLIDGYDIKVGDVLECYKVHHVQPGT